MKMSRRKTDPELAELLRRFGEVVLRSGLLIRELADDFPEHAAVAREVVECEQEGDRIVHDVIRHIREGKGHVPFDRGEGFALLTALDDIIDHTEEAAAQFGLYAVEAPMQPAEELADVLAQAGEQVVGALSLLTAGEDPSALLMEIHRLERVGDSLLRDAVASLFVGGADPMMVIRWKDIFESLEAAIDACQKAANLIEGITLS